MNVIKNKDSNKEAYDLLCHIEKMIELGDSLAVSIAITRLKTEFNLELVNEESLQ